MSQPLSSRNSRTSPVWFFAIFTLFGIVFIAVSFPARELWNARHWIETPCTIVESHVQRHSGSKGSTYSAEVTYTYEVAGRKYTGTRFQFMKMSSSGHGGRAAMLAQYPQGKQAVCYVNPDAASDSVLVRGLTKDAWFETIPVIFLIIGVWGMVWSIRSRNKIPAASRLPWQKGNAMQAADFSTTPPAETELKPASRKVAFFGILLFAVFWNGIISLPIMQVYHRWLVGRHEWFLALFMVGGIEAGHARVAVPRTAMHSLNTGSNKITWKLKVRGSIPRWPDVKDDYPIIVLPAKKGSAA